MNRLRSLETILVLSGALIIFFFIYQINVLLIASVSLIIIGLLSHFVAEKITRFWFKFSQILGLIVSRIILTIIFYIFLTPIAFISRIFRKSPINLKNSPNDSNYVTRDHEYKAADFENVW